MTLKEQLQDLITNYGAALVEEELQNIIYPDEEWDDKVDPSWSYNTDDSWLGDDLEDDE